MIVVSMVIGMGIFQDPGERRKKFGFTYAFLWSMDTGWHHRALRGIDLCGNWQPLSGYRRIL